MLDEPCVYLGTPFPGDPSGPSADLCPVERPPTKSKAQSLRSPGAASSWLPTTRVTGQPSEGTGLSSACQGGLELFLGQPSGPTTWPGEGPWDRAGPEKAESTRGREWRGPSVPSLLSPAVPAGACISLACACSHVGMGDTSACMPRPPRCCGLPGVLLLAGAEAPAQHGLCAGWFLCFVEESGASGGTCRGGRAPDPRPCTALLPPVWGLSVAMPAWGGSRDLGW